VENSSKPNEQRETINFSAMKGWFEVSRVITAKEVAMKFGVSESWVLDRTRKRCPVERRIPDDCIIRSGRRYIRFIESRIDAWIERGCKPSTPNFRTLRAMK
jgi:predicted DNA-binding transcriptional regulator AlpA